MVGGKMRVTPHHVRTLPATHLLQCEQRSARLHVPARPGMPQVMPAKILDPGGLKSGIPGLGASNRRVCTERCADDAQSRRRAVLLVGISTAHFDLLVKLQVIPVVIGETDVFRDFDALKNALAGSIGELH